MFDNLNQSMVLWGLVVVVLLPCVTLAIEEVLTRFQRRDIPLAIPLVHLRNLAMPLLAFFIVAVNILQLPIEHPAVRAIATLLGVATIFVLLQLLQVVCVEYDPEYTWQIRVPNLIFTMYPTVRHSLRWGLRSRDRLECRSGKGRTSARGRFVGHRPRATGYAQ